MLIFTLLFFRCETGRTLIDRNTGRNPQKVSACNIKASDPCCYIILNVMLTLGRHCFVIRIVKKKKRRRKKNLSLPLESRFNFNIV